MPICDSCGNDYGNDYDKRSTITKGNVSGTFDNFECALHIMAPLCAALRLPDPERQHPKTRRASTAVHTAPNQSRHTELVDRA